MRFPVYRTGVAPDPREADAWIIPGSGNSAYEDLPWIHALGDFVSKIAGRSIPLLGICFGHQLMAMALGGKVEKAAKGRGIGLHAYDVTVAGQKIFPEHRRLRLMAAHQDQIIVPPAQATILAASAFCPYAALAYDRYSLSFQPHPEFSVAYERHTILEWQKKNPIDEGVQSEALRSLEKDQADGPVIAPVLARFLGGEPLAVTFGPEKRVSTVGRLTTSVP